MRYMIFPHIRNGRSIILGNGAFSLILGTIFLAQLGNALLASTLPLFARQVTESYLYEEKNSPVSARTRRCPG